ncbi:MurR/RpiR family transcriptional regulator [Pseudonocardia pini]|uniref:MurR/RpiR family transcriptional regulator n=1 Tax=Pseudonocardia pini TaxID=2758030 RepID=UPI0028A5A56A|nr:MurR/RpiR family transcriptional regulator [Pseudonocardia pini]
MTTDLATTPLLEDIRVRSARFSPAEQRVARAVVGDPAHVFELSVTEMAGYSGTSVGTVVRFCQRMGLRGFQDLKLRLARETHPTGEPLLTEVADGDGAGEVLGKVLAGSARALTEGAGTVDAAVLDRLVGVLLGARRIVFAAVGTSAPLAADIAYRLTTIGLPATFPADVHVQHVTARMLGPADVLVAISHTGSTTETLAVTRTAAEAGAVTAALTSFLDSPLTGLVDHLLVAGSRETSYRIEAMTSRLVHLAVLDALYVAIALRSPGTAAALQATGDVLVEHRI